jgi:hypothetical protein
VLQDGPDRGCAGRLDYLLGPLQTQQQPARQGFLGHGNEIRPGGRQQGDREVSGPGDGDAVRHGRGRLDADRVSCCDRSPDGRHRLGLHPDQPRLGQGRAHRDGDAGRKTAPANRYGDRASLRTLFRVLEADGPRAVQDHLGTVGPGRRDLRQRRCRFSHLRYTGPPTCAVVGPDR